MLASCKTYLVLVAGLLLLTKSGTQVDAHNAPPGFADILIAQNLNIPVGIKATPTDGRMVVLQPWGLAWVVKDDVLLPTPFFDIREKVESRADRGLHSLAFDNNFDENGYIYVAYTYDYNGVKKDGIGIQRIVRMTVNGDTAGDEVVLFTFDQLEGEDGDFHYGGALEHGPDDKLYFFIGDYVLKDTSQDMGTIKGKALRLNTDGTIPSDNPFYTEATGMNRAIYANGLRNPWNTAKHPSSGTIVISDVGGRKWEELNVLVEGANYGWKFAEGFKDPGDPAEISFTDPFVDYPHVDKAEPDDEIYGCAIIGGDFYAKSNQTFPPEYHGKYFFGDHCAGWIATMDTTTASLNKFMDGFTNLVDMAVSPVTGDLYYIDYHLYGGRGGVGKITYVGLTTELSIVTHPTDVTAAKGGAASFITSAIGGGSSTGGLVYQWLRNGVAIDGATEARYSIERVSAEDDGAHFRVDASNGVETISSRNAVLRVTNNTVPEPSIQTSVPGHGKYRAGVPFSFSGSATDPEDGTIPATSLEWEIRLNHDNHDHELQRNIVGVGGTLAVPAAIETSTNVWVTLYLTATDANGTAATITERIDPDIVTITLATDPPGLDVILDGDSHPSMYSFDSVVGVQRDISAPRRQVGADGVTYYFHSWEDGLARDKLRLTPSSSTTWTAVYSTEQWCKSFFDCLARIMKCLFSFGKGCGL